MPRLLPLSLALVLGPMPLFAQTPEGKPATRAEYRACLEERDALEPKLAAMRTRNTEHEAAVKQHQQEMDALVATQKSLDTGDAAAVKRFNEKMETLNTRARTLNDNAKAFEADMVPLRAQVAAMNERCSNRVVNERDREAVDKERAARAKK